MSDAITLTHKIKLNFTKDSQTRLLACILIITVVLSNLEVKNKRFFETSLVTSLKIECSRLVNMMLVKHLAWILKIGQNNQQQPYLLSLNIIHSLTSVDFSKCTYLQLIDILNFRYFKSRNSIWHSLQDQDRHFLPWYHISWRKLQIQSQMLPWHSPSWSQWTL